MRIWAKWFDSFLSFSFIASGGQVVSSISAILQTFFTTKDTATRVRCTTTWVASTIKKATMRGNNTYKWHQISWWLEARVFENYPFFKFILFCIVFYIIYIFWSRGFIKYSTSGRYDGDENAVYLAIYTTWVRVNNDKLPVFFTRTPRSSWSRDPLYRLRSFWWCRLEVRGVLVSIPVPIK